MMNTLTIAMGLIPLALGYTGQATYYNNPGRHPGSCGESFADYDLIAALSGDMIRGYRDPKHCFRCARISHEDKNVVVRIVDTCPGCASTSLDLSPAAFHKLAHPDRGIIPIQWEFVNCNGLLPASEPRYQEDRNTSLVTTSAPPSQISVSPSPTFQVSLTASQISTGTPSPVPWTKWIVHHDEKTFLEIQGELHQCRMRSDI